MKKSKKSAWSLFVEDLKRITSVFRRAPKAGTKTKQTTRPSAKQKQTAKRGTPPQQSRQTPPSAPKAKARGAKSGEMNESLVIALAITVIIIIFFVSKMLGVLSIILVVGFFLFVHMVASMEVPFLWAYIPEGEIMVFKKGQKMIGAYGNITGYHVARNGQVYKLKTDSAGNPLTYPGDPTATPSVPPSRNICGLIEKYTLLLKGEKDHNGKILKKDTWTSEMVPIDTGLSQKDLKTRGLARLMGAQWIGIPPFCRVHVYRLQWNKVKKTDSQGSTYEFEARDEDVPTIRFRYPYGLTIIGLRASGNIPIEIDVVATLEAFNVHRMLFRTDSFLVNVQSFLTSALTDYAGTTKIENITKGVHAGEKSEFRKIIAMFNEINHGDDFRTIAELYGVRLISLDFLGYRIVGPNAENLNQASVKVALAERTTQARVILTNGSVDQIRREGAARGEAERAFFDARRGLSDPALQALAFERTGAKTVVFSGNGTQTLINAGGNPSGESPDEPENENSNEGDSNEETP